MWGIWVLGSVSVISELIKLWWPKSFVTKFESEIFGNCVLGVRSMNSLRARVSNIVSQVFGNVSSGCKTVEHCSVCVLRLESEVFRVCVWNVRSLNSLRVCVLKFECVNPWLIHVNVWQKPLQYCKVISFQLIKINGKKLKNKLWVCGFGGGLCFEDVKSLNSL